MDFSCLPIELLQHIFSFLDHQSRLTVLKVCRQWNALASTAQIMDRIWFRINLCEAKFVRQVTAFKCSSRKYRHVVIDCAANRTSRSLRQIPRIPEMLNAISNIETLVLCKMQYMIATDLHILLSNLPNLQRLCLLGHIEYNLQEICFSGLPNVKTWWNDYDQNCWIDILTKQYSLVLQNVTDLTLTVPFDLTFRVNIIQQMFPNLCQLQITVNDPSIVYFIDAYKCQLEKLSIFSITSALLTLLCDITFPKLSHFYMITDDILDQEAITKIKQFFKNPDHIRNFRYLKLTTNNISIIRTICSNRTSLRVLEVFATNFDFLVNMSKLKNLQKLSIRGGARNRFIAELHNHQLPHVSNLCHPIQFLKFVEMKGSFRDANKLLKLLCTVAPNLEVLTLEDVNQPEEALQILSEMSPNIRRLELNYKLLPGKPPELNFGHLMSNTNLVTYCLANVLLDDDSIRKWIQMAPNLSTIVIANCETLSAEHLTIFDASCPKLRHLELKGCNAIMAQELKEAKQKLSHVRIINHRK